MSEISKIKQRLIDSVKKSYRKGTPVKFAPKPEKPMTPPGKKKKVKKKAEGGSLKTVDKQSNPGLAKLPTPVRNKMGYRKTGGKVMSGSELVASCYD